MDLNTIIIAEQPTPVYLRRFHLMQQFAQRLTENPYEDQATAAAEYEMHGSEIAEALAVFQAFERSVVTGELVRDLPLNDALTLVRDSDKLDETLAEAVVYNKHVTFANVLDLFHEMLSQPLNPTAQACARSVLNRFGNLETYAWATRYGNMPLTMLDPEVFDFFAQEANLQADLRAQIVRDNFRLLAKGELPFAYQLGTLHLFSFDQDTDLLVEVFPLFDREVREWFIGMMMTYAEQPVTDDDEQALFHTAVSMLLFRLAG